MSDQEKPEDGPIDAARVMLRAENTALKDLLRLRSEEQPKWFFEKTADGSIKPMVPMNDAARVLELRSENVALKEAFRLMSENCYRERHYGASAMARNEASLRLLDAAFHALRSYGYGNSSPDLALDIANRISSHLGGGGPSCRKCGAVSFFPNDICEGYCASCSIYMRNL